MSQAPVPSRLLVDADVEGDAMKVFVAGATGALATQLVPQLVAGGHEVVGMTRTASKREALRALGARPVVADALDPDAVARAVAEAEPEVIVHQATALSGAPDMRHPDRFFAVTNRLRTEGTDHLIAAGRAVGARRFVAQSYAGWPVARTGGPVKSETDPLDPEAAMAKPVRKRQFPLVGGGGGVWSFVHIEDAASATVAAVERGPGGIYQIVDDEPAPVRDWLPALASALGAKPPLRLPRWLGRLAAGEAATIMMAEVRGASNEKAKRELGWQLRYPSWRQGFAQGLG